MGLLFFFLNRGANVSDNFSSIVSPCLQKNAFLPSGKKDSKSSNFSVDPSAKVCSYVILDEILPSRYLERNEFFEPKI